MKPFPTAPLGGSSGLNVSLHLILLSLALIAGFFLIFRELRRVEVDLHDAIARVQVPPPQPHPQPQPAVFRFNPPFVPLTVPDVVVLPPVPEEEDPDPEESTRPELGPGPGPGPEPTAEAEAEAEAKAEPEPGPEPELEPTPEPEDDLAGLSEDQIMARPAAVLREVLRKRDAPVQGNKQELVKRILALR